MSSPSDTVLKVPLVGEVTQKLLANHGIHTIAELAASNPTTLKVPNAKRIIDNAQQILNPKSLLNPEPSRVIAATTQAPAPAAEVTPAPAALDPEQFVISDHTWYEQLVTIPHPDTKLMIEAAVFEMVLLPLWGTVGLLCCISESPEQVLETPLSPAFLYHFNEHLPPLSIQLTDIDYNTLPNRTALEAALNEVELMRLVRNQMNGSDQ